MKIDGLNLVLVLVIGGLLGSPVAAGDDGTRAALRVGDTLPEFSLADQFGATGEWTALLPGTSGRATFIHLDRLKIRAVDELETAEAVERRIDELLRGATASD